MNNLDMNLRGAKVLLVDDTQANLDVLCELLEREGYAISMAPNGEVALRIVQRVQPDLILLDVMMPGLNGFEVCQRLKVDEMTRDIPVIFITAETLTESVVAGFDAGGVDYILKPFREEEVLVRVDTHLKINHLTKALAKKNDALLHANEQIQIATERKSRFLANITHELRTPMTAIIGFTEMALMREGDRLSEKQRDNLGKVIRSGHRLSDMVNELLDLSKIEAGHVEVDVSHFDLPELLEECCDTLRPLVKSDVELILDVSKDIGEVTSDNKKLRQIVINLLSNAVKFTQAGYVTLRAVQEGDHCVVSVIDTGPGIPPAAIANIFDEFQQVPGTSSEHKGTGLGLSITKSLTHLLDGQIKVESNIPNGAKFTVQIPNNQSITPPPSSARTVFDGG